jgi:hypothetical protein
MTEKNVPLIKQGEIAKGLVEIARQNELSLKDVVETYTGFNYTTYVDYFTEGNEFTCYNPKLEERALELTKEYYRELCGVKE